MFEICESKGSSSYWQCTYRLLIPVDQSFGYMLNVKGDEIKRVFSFGSMRQLLDAANQIAEWHYVTATFEKILQY